MLSPASNNGLWFSVDQMRYLISTFGIDTSRATLRAVDHNDEWHIEFASQCADGIPVFTLEDVLSFFKRWQLSTTTGGVEIIVILQGWDYGVAFPRQVGKNALDATYKMLCYLLRKGFVLQ